MLFLLGNAMTINFGIQNFIVEKFVVTTQALEFRGGTDRVFGRWCFLSPAKKGLF